MNVRIETGGGTTHGTHLRCARCSPRCAKCSSCRASANGKTGMLALRPLMMAAGKEIWQLTLLRP
jgi:hypothetical protein